MEQKNERHHQHHGEKTSAPPSTTRHTCICTYGKTTITTLLRQRLTTTTIRLRLRLRQQQQHEELAQEFWVDTHRRVGGFCGIRQLCEQFPTHLNEVCLQGFAALVNSARDVPRTFSGGLMRWVPVNMTVTLVGELFEGLYKHS